MRTQLSDLNITKKHVRGCLWPDVPKDDGWEHFKTHHADNLLSIKIRRKYKDDEVDLNEDGYYYKMIHVDINKTEHFLYLQAKGYPVEKCLGKTVTTLGEKVIWNKAVEKTLREVRRYDGIIPDENDMEYLVNHVSEKIKYKNEFHP